jgi:hypothetical protein
VITEILLDMVRAEKHHARSSKTMIEKTNRFLSIPSQNITICSLEVHNIAVSVDRTF